MWEMLDESPFWLEDYFELKVDWNWMRWVGVLIGFRRFLKGLFVLGF
jgi:hypothetical protein